MPEANTGNREKAYLAQYLQLKRKIIAIDLAIKEVRERAQDISVHLDPNKVQGSSPIHDPIAEAAAIAADLETKLVLSKEDCMRTMREIQSVLDQVSDHICYCILSERYISGLSWSQIAISQHYEKRQVYRIHGKALKLIRGIMAAEKDVTQCHS